MKHLLSLLAAFSIICSANTLYAQCFSEQSFTAPGEHTYIVPGATTESFLIEIEARGGDGGDFIWSGNPQTDGGEGATMGASFVVNGGDELFIIVGESGSDALGSPGGGGGGGGSAVIINSTDVLLAAAAGGGGGQLQVGFGAGSSTNSSAAGGAGPGTSGGGGFNEAGQNGVGGTGGGAGTLTAQGGGGTQGVVAGPGGDGFGGGAGGSGTVGGGGGGYQGGDGATGSAGNYGGMGGDSYINTLYGSITMTATAGSNGGGSNVDGSVTITCIPSGSVEIAVISQTNPSCFGAPDGSIEVTGLGGVAPYSYTIDGGSSQASGLFENLFAGTYTLMLTDGANNTASVMVTIEDPDELGFTIVQETNATCFGSSDGSIEIIGFGGTTASGLYTYSINGGPFQGTGLFTGLGAGNYIVAVQDDNGCTVDGDASINDQAEIVITLTNQTGASCDIATNGTVTFTSTGGQGGFSYSLDGINFQTPATFSNLAQGDYTVTVMDTDGCTSTLDFSIGLADPFTFLILDSTDTSCDGTGGTVNMLATGGVGGFTYSIDGTSFQMSGSFAGLVAGTYTATASDGVGCTQEIEFSIDMNNVLDIMTSATGPTCQGGMDGSIDIALDDAGAPYEILWTGEGVVPTAEDQFNLGVGIYTITVTDANGCSFVDEIILSAITNLEINLISSQDPSCNGGSNGMVVLSTTGGAAPYTYILDGEMNNSGEFDGLSAGIYQINVEDINGCAESIMITIFDPPISIILMVTNQTEAGCNGDISGTASISAENGGMGTIFYTLAGMTNTTGNFTGLASGTYTASATDDTGCSAEIEVVIIENTTLTGSITDSSSVSCNGGNDGSVTVVGELGSGTYTYSIDGGDSQASGEFTGLAAGDYSVQINDSEGCSSTVTVNISEPSTVVLVIDNIVDATCFGGDDGIVTFSIEGGIAPYNLMSDGNELEVPNSALQTFEDVTAGTYAVFITDANGCTLETSVTIGAPSPISISIQNLSDITCKGADDGGFSYSISGGTGPYIVSQGGLETEVAIDELINESDQAAGLRTLEITDTLGCFASINIIINEPDTLEFIINEQTPASCFGSSDAFISFMITGGIAPYNIIDEDGDAIEIENSDTIESGEAEAGVYPLTIVDANGCTIETVVTITEPEVLELANITIVDSNETGNGSITIEAMGGTEPYTYAIDGNNFQSSPTFTGLAEDTYEVTVLDANGCTFTINATITSTDVSDISSDVLKLSVGPNPASQLIYIHMDMKKLIDLNIKVINIQGKSVMEIQPEVSYGNQTITLDIEHLRSGIYLIDVATEAGHFTKRIIVQH